MLKERYFALTQLSSKLTCYGISFIKQITEIFFLNLQEILGKVHLPRQLFPGVQRRELSFFGCIQIHQKRCYSWSQLLIQNVICSRTCFPSNPTCLF